MATVLSSRDPSSWSLRIRAARRSSPGAIVRQYIRQASPTGILTVASTSIASGRPHHPDQASAPSDTTVHVPPGVLLGSAVQRLERRVQSS